MVDFKALCAPFPKDVVSWRAQHFTQDGSKALALAYIDARDVMNRLDDVCTPSGWQCKYSHANGKTVCDIGININWGGMIVENETIKPIAPEWVWKADGAGDSDIEAEKGALSDAFKRAAVRWGIGRYLYSLEAVWVPCKAEQRNGKWVFKKWTVDPWTQVKPEQKAGFQTARQQNAQWLTIRDEMVGCASEEELIRIWTQYQPELTIFKRTDPDIFNQLEDIKNNRKAELQQEASVRAGYPEEFNKIGARQ